MKSYQTAQRKQLFGFLVRHRDRQFTVEELAQQLEGVSLSAVYRNINRLVADGAVRRFEQEGSRKFLYQYLGDSSCTGHLHLKCEKCDSILHMDPQTVEALARVIRQSNGFDLDKGKSILFGSCSSCK